MTRATLAEVLQPALRDGTAVAGVVCLGWEDARAYVAAAEAERAPIILQAGPGARAHMPLSVWAAMFHALADQASVPVVSHLDHGRTAEECEAAIALGFTSVMFDGSSLPLEENIAQTAAIAAKAHAAGVSCEGEIGYVGYDGAEGSAMTDPDEAARFAAGTGVDAMAISVGNVHLQTTAQAQIDRPRLAAIQSGAQGVPLVLHGGSGLPQDTRRRLAHETAICKFNIGTELRMTFGAALRDALDAQPDQFDRIKLLEATAAPLTCRARGIIRALR